MAKRKGTRDVSAEEIKKSRQDSSSEMSMEEKPLEPAVETPEVLPSGSDALDYIQIIITGPRKCGKSCLVLSYMGQPYPPRRGEFLSKQYLHILPNRKPVMIWDLDSRQEFTRYRQKSYPEADIAFLCFDIKKPENLAKGEESLENLLRPWYDELKENCHDIQIILVGLKSDLKHNSMDLQINSDGIFFSEEERNYARQKFTKISSYMEVSTVLKKDGVDELFTNAIAQSNDRLKPKKMFVNCGFEISRPLWP